MARTGRASGKKVFLYQCSGQVTVLSNKHGPIGSIIHAHTAASRREPASSLPLHPSTGEKENQTNVPFVQVLAFELIQHTHEL